MRAVIDPERAERVVLGAPLEAHPGPLSLDELARVVGDQVAATDAVDGLARDGAVNREGTLVFASRAAVRVDQLRL
jgi:hypothetical protein